MAIFCCEPKNLKNTAQFLINLKGPDFTGISLEEAVLRLKTKTKECYENNSSVGKSIDGLFDGERIWGCYRGVSCLFTPAESSPSNDEILFKDDDVKFRVIVVTYQSVL